MSLVEKLVMPRRLMIAALVAIITLCVAIGVQVLTRFDTQPYVRTVFIFLVLEYVWASVKREFFS
ncbi:MAG: hypothetical protein ACXU8U_03445 [Asticcacaulis sp.]